MVSRRLISVCCTVDYRYLLQPVRILSECQYRISLMCRLLICLVKCVFEWGLRSFVRCVWLVNPLFIVSLLSSCSTLRRSRRSALRSHVVLRLPGLPSDWAPVVSPANNKTLIRAQWLLLRIKMVPSFVEHGTRSSMKLLPIRWWRNACFSCVWLGVLCCMRLLCFDERVLFTRRHFVKKIYCSTFRQRRCLIMEQENYRQENS